jgi:hypothetical protein
MKYLLLTALTVAVLIILALSPAHAGNCDYADDRAADGSRCGKRSADSRY